MSEKSTDEQRAALFAKAWAVLEDSLDIGEEEIKAMRVDMALKILSALRYDVNGERKF